MSATRSLDSLLLALVSVCIATGCRTGPVDETLSASPQWPPTDVNTTNFSVRWKGDINIDSAGSYVFKVLATGGVRLTIGQHQLIHSLGTSSSSNVCNVGSRTLTTQAVSFGVSSTDDLPTGWTPITLDYCITTSTADVHLKWVKPGGSEVLIPADHLRPAWMNKTSTIDPADRIAFSHFDKPWTAKPDYTLVQVSVNDLILVVAFAPIAGFLLGVTQLAVPWSTLLASVALA